MEDFDANNIKSSLVIFLDLLGVKSKLGNIKTKNDYKEIFRQLNFIKNEFAKPPDKYERQYQVHIDKSVQIFSDSVIISLSLESEEAKDFGTFDPFLAELYHFGLCQMTCACNGIFIRG